jgi:hypothetical protein
MWQFGRASIKTPGLYREMGTAFVPLSPLSVRSVPSTVLWG